MNTPPLEEMFASEAVPFREVYETAQIVVRDYMEKNNCKIGRVAELLNTTGKYLYAVLDPNQDKPLSVDRVIELTILTGDPRIIDAMKESGKIRDGASCTIIEVMRATLDVQSHTGELSKSLNNAIADGKIDETERAHLRKIATDELGALHAVLEKLK
jgi:hypothetical protein